MIVNKTDYTLTPIEMDPFTAFLSSDKTSKRMSMDTAGKSAVHEINKLTKFKGVGSLTDWFHVVLPNRDDEFPLIGPSKKFWKPCEGIQGVSKVRSACKLYFARSV